MTRVAHSSRGFGPRGAAISREYELSNRTGPARNT
jgi:hypothetical protein